jgi:ABC-type multidrug transport system fused ATPase/permease subunit
MVTFTIAGENITKRIRDLYVEALLRQEIGWFDAKDTGELTTRMASDIPLIQEGVSDKVGLMLQFTSTFISGFVIGYVKGWRMALVLTCAVPLLASMAFMMSKIGAASTSQSSGAYAEAGIVANQVLSSMRTVSAFGGEKRDIERYNKFLDIAEKSEIKKALARGTGIACFQSVIFLVYALAFYYGNLLVTWKIAGQAEVLNVFFAVLIGAFSLGNASPHIASVSAAVGAAEEIIRTIDRKSLIDSSSALGEKPANVKGDIIFRNVNFHYPTRPDVTVLKSFNLDVKAGQSVALVGSSGSGKSTIVKLLERFYDPIEGDILFDGHDLKSLNVHWLRQSIGMVSQEPVLFNCSIRENILYGLPQKGKNLSLDECNSQIERACKQANAWEFIEKLPKGLDTTVGESGSMLSGFRNSFRRTKTKDSYSESYHQKSFHSLTR